IRHGHVTGVQTCALPIWIAKLKIGILLGDDIGLEVVPESVKVIKAAAAKTGLTIEWHELPIGKAGHEQYGNTLPKITEETLHTQIGRASCRERASKRRDG